MKNGGGEAPQRPLASRATRTNIDETRRLASGTLLAGRYRVAEMLGTGAMGIVYRARDEVLELDVALKVLRPELAPEADLLARFRRELILARQVSHRNVVRIHDIVQDDDLYFLTMDLVEGRSLSEILEERERLPPEEAVAIAEQLGDALAAAHREGVVHRDLKPSNILIDEEGRAFITDFGVARSAAAAGLTQVGTVVGTPDYLSPEQVEGAEATARSDLYALGIVFFEMLTGRLPFPSGSMSETLARRLTSRPPSWRRSGASVPAWLRRVIARLLRREPRRRYSSAEELVDELRQRSGPRRSVPWIAGAAIVAAAILMAWAFWPGGGSEPRAAVSNASTIAVLPFADDTGKPELAWLPAALPDLLSTTLSEAAALRVVSFERVVSSLENLKLPGVPREDGALQQISELFDADNLLIGGVRLAGDRVLAEARLVQTGAGGELSRRSLEPVSAPLDRPEAVVEGLSDTLLRELAVPDRSDMAALVAPSSALIPYTEGVALQRRGDALGARDMLEEAVSEAEDFGAAWLRLAEAYDSLGMEGEALEAARRALSLLGAEGGRLGLEAKVLDARWRGDPEGAVEALRQLAERFPNDLEAQIELGDALGSRGALPEAIDTLEAVTESAPHHPRAWYLLGKYSILAGDSRRAIEEHLVRALVLQNQLANLQGQADVLNAFGVAYRQQGQLSLAAEYYERAAALRQEIGDRRGYATTLRNLAQIDILRGRYAEAEASLERAVSHLEDLGDSDGIADLRNDLGILAEDRGQPRRALASYRSSLKMRQETGDRRAIAESLNNVGYAYYLLGEFDNASVYWNEALDHQRSIGDPVGLVLVQQNLGQLRFAQGDWDESLRLNLEALEGSREADFTPGVGASLGQLGRVALAQGRFAAALGFFGEALEVMTRLEDVRGLTEFTLGRAATFLELGLHEEAGIDLERASSWLEEAGNAGQRAELLRLRARRLEAVGDLTMAADLLDQASREAAASGNLATVLRVDLARGRSEVLRGNDGRGEEILDSVWSRASGLRHVELAARAALSLASVELRRADPAAAARWLAETSRRADRLGPWAAAHQLYALQGQLARQSEDATRAQELERRTEAEWRRLAEGLEDSQREGLMNRLRGGS